MEIPEVYEATHREILRWVADYGVRGIRIDHPDGLAAPAQYLQRLAASAPDVWVVVEKITQLSEELPEDWPVAGMTGYDALGQINAVLADPEAEAAIEDAYIESDGGQAIVARPCPRRASTMWRRRSCRRSFADWPDLRAASTRRKQALDPTRGGLSRLSLVPARRHRASARGRGGQPRGAARSGSRHRRAAPTACPTPPMSSASASNRSRSR